MLAPLLALMLFASQPPAPTPPESGERQQQDTTADGTLPANQQDNAQPSPTSDPAIGSVDDAGDPQDNGDRELDRSSADWWIVLAPLLSAAAAIVIAVFAGFQFFTMRAAQQLAALAQRPWVNLWTLHLTPFFPPSDQGMVRRVFEQPEARFEPGHPITAVIGFRNSGGTPAFIVEARVRYGVFAEVPASLDFDDLPQGAGVPGILVRNEETNWRHVLINAGLSLAEYEAIRGGHHKLLIWGKVSYKETKSDRATRLTKFARLYDPTVDKPVWGGRFSFPDIECCNDAT